MSVNVGHPDLGSFEMFTCFNQSVAPRPLK